MSTELMAAIGFLLAFAGAVGGFWRYIHSQGKEIKSDCAAMASAAQSTAALAREELAAHKLHVAETYISKQGHRESTDQILDAINRVNERLDRAFEPKSRAARNT